MRHPPLFEIWQEDLGKEGAQMQYEEEEKRGRCIEKVMWDVSRMSYFGASKHLRTTPVTQSPQLQANLFPGLGWGQS